MAVNELTPSGVEQADFEPPRDDLLQCLAYVAKHYGKERTLASWRQGLPAGLADATPQVVLNAAEAAGFHATLVQRNLREVQPYLLPVIVLLKDGGAFVWLQDSGDGMVSIATPEGEDVFLPVHMRLDELQNIANGYCIFIKPALKSDERAGSPLPKAQSSWLWGTLWQYRSYYTNTIVAAVLINVLTLAGTFFTMNVYDRVVPNQAYTTLWTLAIGTLLAMVFEFFARQIRSQMVDVAGKKADLIIGADLFRQALAVRLEARPASSGSFANELREFESLRDFAASATVASLTDLPFALLFIAVISMIGGPLAWVPILALPLVVLVGVAIQWPLSRYMQENLRESSLKHGLLIEALEGIETLKATNGQGYMQKRWEDYCALSATSSLKSRLLTSLAINFVSFVQQIQTVLIVVWGVYLIGAGTLTMGALIGTVILAGRSVAPLAQIVGLAVRFQQAKTSLQSLNGLMAKPTDRDAKQNYLPRKHFDGAVRTEALSFTYPNQKLVALDRIDLNIQPGERIAILGRIGSGKSTLLRLLNGLYLPSAGSVYADNIDLRQIDPADIHRNIGMVTQECELFYGTLRENVMLAAPHASPEKFLHIARLTGLDTLAARHPLGFEMQLGEGGAGLSGGQRQLVSLARCLLSEPSVILMDEPTSAMDGQTEGTFISRFQQILGNRTLIVATHRFSLVPMMTRVIVLDNGRIVADGPRDKVMQALSSGQIAVPKQTAVPL
jgi:ATP-binding cassette, subfamily C, bacterial LapB